MGRGATTAHTRQLTITADDFGMSAGVNLAVASAATQGVLTAASWMANGRRAEEAAAEGRRLAHLDVGVHLVLTCGRPITSPEAVSSLVSGQGTFWDLRAFLRRLSTGRISLAEVRKEWQAQVDRGDRLGLHLQHLDGHHHVQLHPQLAPIAADIAAARGMSVRCRAPRWPCGTGMRPLVARLTLSAWEHRSRHCWGQTAGPDRVWSLAAGAAARDGDILLKWARRLRSGWTEWILHPAAYDDVRPETDSYGTGRLGEYGSLLHPDLPRALAGLIQPRAPGRPFRLAPLECD